MRKQDLQRARRVAHTLVDAILNADLADDEVRGFVADLHSTLSLATATCEGLSEGTAGDIWLRNQLLPFEALEQERLR